MNPSIRAPYLPGLAVLCFLCACPGPQPMTDGGSPDASVDAGIDGGPDGGPDAGPDGGPDGGIPSGPFCSLPGSYIATSMTGGSAPVSTTLIGSSPACNGMVKGHSCTAAPGVTGVCQTSLCAAGGAASCLVCAPDLSWMQIPPGFCAHWFGKVSNGRQLRFAPGGELFVGSPDAGTTSGGGGGQAAIMVLADDDHDGYADSTSTFLGNLSQTQGLMFTSDSLYYQDYSCIRRLPYKAGERVSSGDPNPPANDVCVGGTGPMRNTKTYGAGVIDITLYESGAHWPKNIDMADDGTIYVTNGGDQGEMCLQPMPFHGGIWAVDGTAGGLPIVKGLRNPIAMRCQKGHNHCFALELAQDYSWNTPGSEKLLLVHAGDNWGYPCCADQNLVYKTPTGADTTAYAQNGAGVLQPVGPPDCSQITPTTNAFEIAETPFGLDFESGGWPAPWTNSVIVAMHGAFASWVGARVVAIATDPSTGLPRPTSDVDGGMPAAMSDFATGWDDARRDHGRPTAVAVSSDGRLFLSNDQTGDIIWFAPVQLGASTTDAGTP